MAISSTPNLIGILVFYAVIEGMMSARLGHHGAGRHGRKMGASTSSSEFQCKTGGNITSSLKCDGHADCEDKSDEADCHKRGKNYWLTSDWCYNDEIVCQTSGNCIPQEWECDGIVDCWDESDEYSCFWKNGVYMKKDHVKSSGQERKTSKVSVPVDWCPLYYTPCYYTGACIHETWWCDGENDCGDYSDEEDCFYWYKGSKNRRL